MSTQNPFLRAHLYVSSALTLLEHATPPPEQAASAIDSLCALRLLFEVYAKRNGIDRIQFNILADDFETLPGLLPDPRFEAIRMLIARAQRIVATCAAQPAGVDVVREVVH